MTLLAVTKGVGVEFIQQALMLGLTDIGENRVQEARAKQLALGSKLQALGKSLEPSASNLQPVRWHLIGHLQRNKAKYAVESFDSIHSVDSVELVDALERHAAQRARGARFEALELGLQPRAYSREPIQLFIQVNVSGEATKFGCRPTDALSIAAAIREGRSLRLAGLMTIAPFAQEPETARPVFRRLRALRDALQVHGAAQPLKLSMGMSHDFEIAIEEGADVVRIGTAIFGARDPGHGADAG